jgi:hypothetical protein
MFLAGDFNCVISNADSTGQGNYSKALERLIRGRNLKDVWDAKSANTIFTHYTTKGASRIDRIYVTENLKRTQQGAETVAAVFTDHMAIILRLSIDIPSMTRGRGYWRMNVSYLREPPLHHRLQKAWKTWRRHNKYYPKRLLW